MAEAIRFHRDGDCLWVKPQTSRADLCLTPEMGALRAKLDSSGIVRIVIDLSELPHFGSMLLDLLVVLWRRVARRDGKLILYKPSAVGREVLAAAKLDQLWPIAQTREEACDLAHTADVA